MQRFQDCRCNMAGQIINFSNEVLASAEILCQFNSLGFNFCSVDDNHSFQICAIKCVFYILAKIKGIYPFLEHMWENEHNYIKKRM